MFQDFRKTGITLQIFIVFPKVTGIFLDTICNGVDVRRITTSSCSFALGTKTRKVEIKVRIARRLVQPMNRLFFNNEIFETRSIPRRERITFQMNFGNEDLNNIGDEVIKKCDIIFNVRRT